MKQKNSSEPTRNDAPATRSDRDSLRWAAGLTLFFLGLFGIASSLFYFADWQADYSIVHGIETENPLAESTVDNPCGFGGAWIAEQLIGRSFGLFGLIIPIVITVLGLRIIRRKRLVLNHFLLSAGFVLLLGSLTLGFAFGEQWNLFNSGWGGAYGIELALWLQQRIGAVGTIILLVGGWILTGVFINRNFINTVNSAGNAVVGQSNRLGSRLRNFWRNRKAARAAGEAAPEAADERREPVVLPPARPFTAEPAPEPILQEVPSVRDEQPVVLPPAPQPAAVPDPLPFDTEPAAEPLMKEVPAFDSETAVAEALRAASADPSAERPGDMDQMEEELRKMELGFRNPVPPLPQPEEKDPFSEQPVDGPEAESAPAETAGPAETTEPDPDPESDPDNPFREVVLTPEGQPEAPQQPAEEPRGVTVTVFDTEAKVLDESQIDDSLYDPLKDLVNYRKPSPGLLENYPADTKVSDEEIFENKRRIEEILSNFGIPIKNIYATSGPTVTLYEIVQAEGVRISKIKSLEDDIAQSLKALGIRLIAPIPGRGTIGIEVPNLHKQIVSMYSAICSPEFQEKAQKMQLPIVIGQTIQKENFVFDLAKAPHLLVAGATGQGKSVGLNAIITSLLYMKHPAELKFVLIDPKMVEFSLYAGLERHFLAKMESEEEAIITDPKKAVYTLHALETEMEQRLELCKKAGVRNIVEYNEKFVNRRLPPPKGHRYLPYIVVIIDEFADLIMTAKEVERPVMRLAQKARAIGIHLIVATQRPDVKIITGGIKANFPARIAFRTMQMTDSRTIIDQPGAQQLIGRGDMLYTTGGDLIRMQCALVETPEVERIVSYIARQQGYTEAYPLPDYTPEGGDAGMGMGSSDDGESGRAIKYDALFAEIARTAVEQHAISVSMIQRNYEVGFNRAGRIMQQLQAAGIVGPQFGAKPRDILFHDLPSLEAKLQDLGVF